MRKWSRWFAASLLAAAGGAGAQSDFPPITAEEQALKEVAGQANAPAVYLFRKGRLSYSFSARKGLTARLEMAARIKVLTEEGKRFGELRVEHGKLLRLEGIAARTVLADGQVRAIPPEAVFLDKLSEQRRFYATKAAFPAVEVGSILDYRYELRFDTPLLIEPWVFHQDIPTLYSEIVYLVPRNVSAHQYVRDPQGLKPGEERSTTEGEGIYRAWARDVPPLPDEPLSHHGRDLATVVATVLDTVAMMGEPVSLQLSWNHLARQMRELYEKSLRDAGDAARLARSLTSSLPAAPARVRALALYRFVRDEVATTPGGGVWLDKGSEVDDALKRRAGTVVEKALLLAGLLRGVEIANEVVVAGGTGGEGLDPRLPTILPLEHAVVVAAIDGRNVALDPSDPCLGFGQLLAEFEGAAGLRVQTGTLTRLPTSSAADNLRKARLELTLDAEGRASGVGTLTVSGQRAAEACRIGRGEDDPEKAWREWLEKRFGSFQVAGARAERRADSEQLIVSWEMSQREEEVLGTDATLRPCQPFGPFRQSLTLKPEERKTPVVLPFAASEDLEVALTWSDGWEVEAQPENRALVSDLGTFSISTSVDAAARRLTYTRRLDLRTARLEGLEQYRATRDLFAHVEKNDAQALVLVRR